MPITFQHARRVILEILILLAGARDGVCGHAKIQLDDGGGPVSYTCAVHTTATAAARLRWASCVLVSRW